MTYSPSRTAPETTAQPLSAELSDELRPLMSFEEFVEWHPDEGQPYELFDGVPRKMPNATGPHQDVGGFLAGTLFVTLRAHCPDWYVPSSATIKPLRDQEGYKPDVVILDRTQLENEPLWKKRSSIVNGSSVPLIIEIVSTNWRDDYYRKLAEYEAMGIAEYWMVDYAALGGVRYIGKPKQPTITVCVLVEGEYELRQFRAGDVMVSAVLPELALTVDEVLAIAQ